MVTRELKSPPRMLGLYARTVAPLVPGASRLPFVGGGGGAEIPELALSLSGVRAERVRVAAYSRVCGFTRSEELPPTYPHVLAFPLHLALMADGDFPFTAMGLVHVANRIAQKRPIGLDEHLDVRVHATALEAHQRGRVFSLVTEARVGRELVWRELSTMLRRERRAEGAERTAADPSAPSPAGATSAEWRLAGDLGRRYAAVSGDRNPIHMHPLSARALGFPCAIAHGMWTKARCLAALRYDDAAHAMLSGAFAVDVRFRRPILLPATVAFTSARAPRRNGVVGEAVRFAVHATTGERTDHLDGRLRPVEDIEHEQEEAV
jgi:acyl dehydratase